MVRAVDDFVVDSFRSVTRSFLFLVGRFFFVTLMILNYCLMIYRNRLYMEKVKRKDGLFNPEQCEQQLRFIFAFFCIEIHMKNLSDVELQKLVTARAHTTHTKKRQQISPVQISCSSLQNSTTFCFIFSVSAKKRLFF
jgi:hypothetical protein